MSRPGKRGRVLARVMAGAGLAALAAGCGTQTTSQSTPALQVQTAPLATSLVTAQGTWAVTVMGGSAATENNFWQMFIRPVGASRWSLVTPEGVADNGGLIAAAGPGGTSLLAGFRPSQGMVFSPLATSSDAGRTWAPGLLDAALANAPDGLAVAASGQALALLSDGTVESAPTPAATAAGQWSRLTTLAALAATAPGRECGLAAVNAVSFGPGNVPMAAGSCVRRGVAGIFADTGGGWQAAGPALPAGLGGDQVQVLALTAAGGGNAALLRADGDLVAAWSHDGSWSVSAPIAAGAVTASGFGPAGSVWALAGGRAEVIGGPGQGWRALPAVPAGTSTLAPGSGSSYDALAVSGATLTVWRLGAAGWSQVQVIKVPITYGSSS